MARKPPTRHTATYTTAEAAELLRLLRQLHIHLDEMACAIIFSASAPSPARAKRLRRQKKREKR